MKKGMNLRRGVGALAIAALMTGWPAVSGAHASSQKSRLLQTAANSYCGLTSRSGTLKHVIYIQFDNTHLTRDNPNVPSDLQQMPHLLNFIEGNGVMVTHEHTPLIAHTADDILTSVTGLYGDRHGQPVSNSYRYFRPDGTSNPAGSFAYWTDPVVDYTGATPTDHSYTMVTQAGKNTPAPWVAYTRAGCNFGSIASANSELENTSPDVAKVFGANSPQAAEAQNNPDQASADFMGIAVHCARQSTVCAANQGGVPDVLPDEPGGYTGYSALFGHEYVAPQIHPGAPLRDLNGNIIQYTSNGHSYVGFPGYSDMTPSVTLSYVLAMQTHGIPVTYAYIADAHENHQTGVAYGPGETGYVRQLRAYDDAFGKFFDRLQAVGITKSNTLFVFTSDEGDHFVGGAPTPAGCNGVTVPCTYTHIGEIDANLPGLLQSEQGITTPFGIHDDSAPAIYINGNPQPNAAVTRQLERATGRLTALNLLTQTKERVTNYLADRAEMRFLHMVTGDALRTPTFTMFGKPDYYFCGGESWCPAGPSYVGFDSYDAWNHGTVSHDINTTWLGFVGPGVRQLGVDNATWADETDIRPTMLLLAGLRDDYVHDGRALIQDIEQSALPDTARDEYTRLLQLGYTLKQINAPVGRLGLSTLNMSTVGMESTSPGDAAYLATEQTIRQLTGQRDDIAARILAIIESAEFNRTSYTAAQIDQVNTDAQALLQRVASAPGDMP